AASVVTAAPTDPRHIETGVRIPDEGYCDQPYVVITREGHWLCTLTTGPGREGEPGQHVVSTISTDQGESWSPLVDIEPAGGPEASWAIPLVTPSGRIYVFYTYNGDRVDRLPGSKRKIRADVLGWYCYRYSDDGGRSWSRERHRLPLRVTACDRANNWKGKVQMFWGIDKPKTADGHVRFAFTKLGRYILDDGEGWMFHSDNILTESDPARIRWEMLPVGERGIRAPEFGSVQEEHNHVVLDRPDRLYLVYRTTMGYPCHSYSEDGGRSWSRPVPMTYTPGGRKIKNPRACPKLFSCRNGKYLFWFHNHGGRSYQGRNPAWICGGRLRNGKMSWSQPEILLYHDDPRVRMSYPDLIEQDGRFWITETQKSVARVHEIDPALLEGLWNQGTLKKVTNAGLLFESPGGNRVRLARTLDLGQTGGLAIDMWLALDAAQTRTLLDSRDRAGRGLRVSLTAENTVRLELRDGRHTAVWNTDPGLLEPGKRHHVVAIVEARPRIILFVVDGQLCDGGDHRQYGWGRYSDPLGDVTGSRTLRISPQIKHLRFYRRPLRVSEAIANYHAGRQGD
ncbi:MAG TPA: hypothetical protein EYP14_13865, partial [Planctomycetaceae bacterium]|nr:hypothetical protein [Planctomycetaceae bacterium]